MAKVGFREKDGRFLVWCNRNRKKIWLYQGRDRERALVIRDRYRVELKDFGLAGLEWSPRERAELAEAKMVMEPFEASISDAVQFYAEHHAAVEDVDLAEAVEWFLGGCLIRELRSATINSYQVSLRRFAVSFSGIGLRDLKGAVIINWLMEMPVANLTRQNNFDNLNIFFKRVIREQPGWLTRNPIEGMADRLPVVRRRSRVGFLTVDETQRFLDAAPVDHKGMFAILIFTGIRTTEARLMRTSSVKVGRKIIEVQDVEAKTGHARLIEDCPDCLWEWLREYPLAAQGPIVPSKAQYGNLLVRAREHAGIEVWPSNAFRHGFASYYYAATGRDVGLVMEIMGHKGSPGLFHNHYKGKVTKAEGQAFCRILPE